MAFSDSKARLAMVEPTRSREAVLWARARETLASDNSKRLA